MKATDKQINAWAWRHGLIGSMKELREAFEDAQILVQVTPPCQPLTEITHEQHIALREAFANESADAYFIANPSLDTYVGRKLFDRGFTRGFDSYARAFDTAHGIKPQPDHFAGAGEIIDSDARADTELHKLAKHLIRRANELGRVVTIERRPLKPLAMGNAAYSIALRPVRGKGRGTS
jgi:hypothetical protein